MATLALDMIVNAGETADQAAREVAGEQADQVTWTVGKSGNSWPEITYTGSPEALEAISARYEAELA